MLIHPDTGWVCSLLLPKSWSHSEDNKHEPRDSPREAGTMRIKMEWFTVLWLLKEKFLYCPRPQGWAVGLIYCLVAKSAVLVSTLKPWEAEGFLLGFCSRCPYKMLHYWVILLGTWKHSQPSVEHLAALFLMPVTRRGSLLRVPISFAEYKDWRVLWDKQRGHILFLLGLATIISGKTK